MFPTRISAFSQQLRSQKNKDPDFRIFFFLFFFVVVVVQIPY
jgi:hypothetical protein